MTKGFIISAEAESWCHTCFGRRFLSAEWGDGSFSLADSRANDDAVGIDKKVWLLSNLSDSLEAAGDRQQSDQM